MRIDPGAGFVIIGIIPVGDPFPNISRHVEKAETVGFLFAYRVGFFARILIRPGVIIQV